MQTRTDESIAQTKIRRNTLAALWVALFDKLNLTVIFVFFKSTVWKEILEVGHGLPFPLKDIFFVVPLITEFIQMCLAWRRVHLARTAKDSGLKKHVLHAAIETIAWVGIAFAVTSAIILTHFSITILAPLAAKVFMGVLAFKSVYNLTCAAYHGIHAYRASKQLAKNSHDEELKKTYNDQKGKALHHLATSGNLALAAVSVALVIAFSIKTAILWPLGVTAGGVSSIYTLYLIRKKCKEKDAACGKGIDQVNQLRNSNTPSDNSGKPLPPPSPPKQERRSSIGEDESKQAATSPSSLPNSDADLSKPAAAAEKPADKILATARILQVLDQPQPATASQRVPHAFTAEEVQKAVEGAIRYNNANQNNIARHHAISNQPLTQFGKTCAAQVQQQAPELQAPAFGKMMSASVSVS